VLADIINPEWSYNSRFGDYLLLVYPNELWVKDTTNTQKTNDTTQTDQQNSQDQNQNTHPMEAVQKREGHSTDPTLEAGRKRLLRTVTTLRKAWKIVTVFIIYITENPNWKLFYLNVWWSIKQSTNHFKNAMQIAYTLYIC
jgi:uncharacterized protein Veg